MATNALLLCCSAALLLCCSAALLLGVSLDLYPIRISVIVQHKISEIQHFFAAL
ncbi:hypothetical protein [Herbaspirillum seropedicae]|uniref:hypothetical protein n=1 Tax=Herbaspirillum seropedicae TaxID=964 RepID=UPI00285E3BB6|nr:hypothetical protein [Herbaspirillum seropedicae]MDR6397202.1 hypothetical protein [Herbaspirillum seropedicae]